MTSVPLSRRVRVRGTTWTTFGRPRNTRAAVTTIAGRVVPASAPAGAPRSSSMMSPGVSIEPGHFLIGEGTRKLLSHLVLAEQSDGSCDRVGHRLFPVRRQLTKLFACRSRDTDSRGLAHSPTLRACR